VVSQEQQVMGVREWLDQHRQAATGIGVGIVVIAIASVVWQVMAQRKTYPTALPDSYFTADDGKTFFVANSENIPPFDYKGQQAVHAYVFECDSKRFVGYMDRYLPEARLAVLAGKRTPAIERFGREMKKPGDPTWTKAGDLAVEAKITDVKCPDGHGTPEEIEP
jgi:hypothetical protein